MTIGSCHALINLLNKFLKELLDAMKGPKYFNHDDAMTDYFHRSHYTDINIGKWSKPYTLVKEVA